jgi:peptidoglycan/xylan/chitin deacetylase (PgdA/CDA1 family)
VKKLCILFLLTLVLRAGFSQKQVAITIDDIPNVEVFSRNKFSSPLLNIIIAIELPVAIFINEGNVYKNEFVAENKKGLSKWLNSAYITAGNHGYSHMNYSDTTLAAFEEDVKKGALITGEALGRSARYFRFPYNSMGKDSVAHQQVKKFLKKNKYINTPFTIESEDWVFNTAYEAAWKSNDLTKAQQIGEMYLEYTLALFEHFEKICLKVYGRNIRQIYLCHDNRLNADYMLELIKRLTQRGYSYITLDEALKDKVYQSQEYYSGRFGFSWIYRWEKDEAKRKSLMKHEPTYEIVK